MQHGTLKCSPNVAGGRSAKSGLMTGLTVRESYDDVAKMLAPRRRSSLPADLSKLSDAELAQLYRDEIRAAA
jgi:hypothetical protein